MQVDCFNRVVVFRAAETGRGPVYLTGKVVGARRETGVPRSYRVATTEGPFRVSEAAIVRVKPMAA